MINIGMSENNTQRQSSSTAQPTPESNLQADSPLDGASCSASSLFEEQVRAIIKKVNNEKNIRDRCWSRKYNPNFYNAAVRAKAHLELPDNEFGFSEEWLKNNAEWP
jgi:hypothetical protein